MRFKNPYRNRWVKDKKRLKNCISLCPLSCPPGPLPVQRAFDAAQLELNAFSSRIMMELVVAV
jgi:hypothetical protein